MRTYQQLTQEQRYQIYPGTARQGRCALKKTGHSGSEIATVIGSHKSTVGRELKMGYSNNIFPRNTTSNLSQTWKLSKLC